MKNEVIYEDGNVRATFKFAVETVKLSMSQKGIFIPDHDKVIAELLGITKEHFYDYYNNVKENPAELSDKLLRFYNLIVCKVETCSIKREEKLVDDEGN